MSCWTDPGTTDAEAATDFCTALFYWSYEEMRPDSGVYRMVHEYGT